jgi:hypothetical protein
MIKINENKDYVNPGPKSPNHNFKEFARDTIFFYVTAKPRPSPSFRESIDVCKGIFSYVLIDVTPDNM